MTPRSKNMLRRKNMLTWNAFTFRFEVFYYFLGFRSSRCSVIGTKYDIRVHLFIRVHLKFESHYMIFALINCRFGEMFGSPTLVWNHNYNDVQNMYHGSRLYSKLSNSCRTNFNLTWFRLANHGKYSKCENNEMI